MGHWAKQSTAVSYVVGPILDSTGAEYASAVIGDLSISKNGGTLTALASAATLTYIANGQYTLALTTGNTDTLGTARIFCNKSTYQMPPLALMVLPATVYDALTTNATNVAGGLLAATATITATGAYIGNATAALSVDASGRVDVIKIAGTTQTARDIGASVLLSSGTGTGQLKLASGYVAMTWADVAAPTTAVNLSGTTIAVTQKVDVDTIKTNPVVNAGTITFPTGATLASTTNITTATITAFSGSALTYVTGIYNATGLLVIASNAPVGDTGSTTTTVNVPTLNALYNDNTINYCLLLVVSGDGDVYTRWVTGYTKSTRLVTIDAALPFTPSVARGDAVYLYTVRRDPNVDAAVSSRSTLTQTQVTGGAYSVQSASCVLGDARIANLDAAVTSRMATYTQPTGFLTTTFGATVGTSTLTQTQVTGGAYALNNVSFSFNSGLDFTATQKAATLARVTLVDTATVTTDLTNLPTIPANWLTAAGTAADFTTEIQTGLATAASIAALNNLSAAQVNAEVDTALSDVGLTTTVTGRIDAAVTTRASATVAPSWYSSPVDVSANVTAIKAKTDQLQFTGAGNVRAAAGSSDFVHTSGKVWALDDGGNPIASAAAVSALSIPTAAQNADALLGRNVAGGSSAGRTVSQALFALRNKVAIVAGTMTVYSTDDTTSSWTAAVTGDETADPIVTVDPA